jgi:pimeloyl-ACP methyl ester carboxylesterase
MPLAPLLAVLLLAAPAAAPTPPPPPAVSSGGFVHFYEEKQFAEETVEAKNGADGFSIAGHVSGTLPSGTTLTIDHVTKLSKDGARAVDYTATLSATGRTIVFHATATEKGWRLEGKEGEVEPVVVEKEIAGPSVLFDNNMAEHLDVFFRSLAIEPGASQTLTAVVPQVMQAVPLKVTRMPDGKARFAGSEIPVRRYRMEAASLLLEITASAKDGALLEANIPLQKASYRARGYEPAAKQDVADPREMQTVLPTIAGDLPAVLTLPSSESKVPAAILLSGSGPNDRDETIGPNRPFRDLARGLADRGIATFRFDKRTTLPVKDASAPVTLDDEYVTDALKALEILAANPKIDATRLYVVGHSLGAAIAPVVAKRSGKVRGVVLLAAPYRRVDVLILDQIRFQLELAGTDKERITEELHGASAALEAIRTKSPDAPALYLGAPADYWRELFALDIVGSIRATALPVLVVQGEKDIQVKVDQDFVPLKAALGDGDGNYRYVRIPGLNHLFMKTEGDSTGAEYAVAGTMDPAVIEAVANFVKEVPGKK